MRFLILSLLFICIGYNADAQQARVHRFTTPLAGKVVLSQVEDKYNVSISGMELPEPDGASGQDELNEVKRKVSAQYPYNVSKIRESRKKLDCDI